MVRFFDFCVRKQPEEARMANVFKHVPIVPLRGRNEGIKLGGFSVRQKKQGQGPWVGNKDEEIPRRLLSSSPRGPDSMKQRPCRLYLPPVGPLQMDWLIKSKAKNQDAITQQLCVHPLSFLSSNWLTLRGGKLFLYFKNSQPPSRTWAFICSSFSFARVFPSVCLRKKYGSLCLDSLCKDWDLLKLPFGSIKHLKDSWEMKKKRLAF